MKNLCLLLSASALSTISLAAYSADNPIIAEPEAAEYVRICDVYGAGYFYIPGTETCLRVGGYLRYEIRAGDGPYGGHNDVPGASGGTDDTYHAQARFALRTWTGSETELGTLSTFTQTNFSYRDGYHDEPNFVSLYYGWIQLGGLRIGKDESVFDTFANFAGPVIGDDFVPFTPVETNLISYTYKNDSGLSAVVSLEQGGSSYGNDYTIDSYVPHIVGGLKYTAKWGGLVVVAGYDSNYEEGAIKARLDGTINEQLSLFVMAGYGTGDEDSFNYYKPWKGDWAVWGGGSYRINKRLKFNLQASYSDSGVSKGSGAARGQADNHFAVVTNVNYEPVPGLVITPEVAYFSLDDGQPATDDDGFSGMFRFQRNF